MPERIARIKKKIEDAKTFHCKSRLEVGETWSEEKISALEAGYGFVFPDDCRAFLLHIGDRVSGLHITFKGGYFKKAANTCELEYEYTPIPIYKREYPGGIFTIGMYHAQELMQDNLAVIANGKFKGRLAYVNMISVVVLDFPDFLAMLEHWLESLTSVVPFPKMTRSHWFSDRLIPESVFPYEPQYTKISEDDFFKIINDPANNEKTIQWALMSVSRAEGSSSKMVDTFRQYYHNPNTAIRYTAMSFGFEHTDDDLALWLQDPSETIRYGALCYAADDEFFRPDILQMLCKEKQDFVMYAYDAIEDKLSQNDIFYIINNCPYSKIVAEAIPKFKGWTEAETHILAKYLNADIIIKETEKEKLYAAHDLLNATLEAVLSCKITSLLPKIFETLQTLREIDSLCRIDWRILAEIFVSFDYQKGISELIWWATMHPGKSLRVDVAYALSNASNGEITTVTYDEPGFIKTLKWMKDNFNNTDNTNL